MSSSINTLCLYVTFCPQGMVTFSDPKELRQALIEMNHHMVSSEMTAPEGGLASLVQHVLHVKLTEVGALEYQHLSLNDLNSFGLFFCLKCCERVVKETCYAKKDITSRRPHVVIIKCKLWGSVYIHEI